MGSLDDIQRELKKLMDEEFANEKSLFEFVQNILINEYVNVDNQRFRYVRNYLDLLKKYSKKGREYANTESKI